MEIQVKEGGTGLHKTIREINLVYKGLRMATIDKMLPPAPICHLGLPSLHVYTLLGRQILCTHTYY